MTGKDGEHEYLQFARGRRSAAAIRRARRRAAARESDVGGAIDPVGGETLAWLTRT